MPREYADYCCRCGVRKDSANHWYVLLISRDAMHIHQWTDASTNAPGAKFFCGEACLSKAISERLGRESFAADAQPCTVGAR